MEVDLTRATVPPAEVKENKRPFDNDCDLDNACVAFDRRLAFRDERGYICGLLLEMILHFMPMGGRPESEEGSDMTPIWWTEKAGTQLPYDTAEKLEFRKKHSRKVRTSGDHFDDLRHSLLASVKGKAPAKEG